MSATGESSADPSGRIFRLCERARACGEPYVFIAGRWVLGETHAERMASLALVAAQGLYLIIADENITRTPQGQELRHHRPRVWEDD